uniref:Uncharacterized protein n=2 Tax=Aegilops tauschii subsp. strangulata TaxID=200361 RepID=A0A453QBX5_AEGTS
PRRRSHGFDQASCPPRFPATKPQGHGGRRERGPRHSAAAGPASPQRKKVLGERNGSIPSARYSQRSRKVKVPVSQRMPSVPPRRVPVLAPHNTVPLPVFHSVQPVQRIVPKQESSACLELPVQSLLSESDQSVCLNVPSIGHRDRDQKVEQEDVCASMFHQLVIGIVIRKFSKRMVALKGLQMAVLWIIKTLTDQSHRWFSCSESSHLSMQIAQDEVCQRLNSAWWRRHGSGIHVFEEACGQDAKGF